MGYVIRKVSEEDGQDITDIFNYFVENSFAAYPEKRVQDVFFERLKRLAGDFPIYAIVKRGGGLAGFGMLRPYHTMETFKRTAELTYFILPAHMGKGLGTKLLNILIEEAQKKSFDTLLASISSLNEISLNFHLKNGFTECGRFKRIGKKFGQNFDEVWMQRFII